MRLLSSCSDHYVNYDYDIDDIDDPNISTATTTITNVVTNEDLMISCNGRIDDVDNSNNNNKLVYGKKFTTNHCQIYQQEDTNDEYDDTMTISPSLLMIKDHRGNNVGSGGGGGIKKKGKKKKQGAIIFTGDHSATTTKQPTVVINSKQNNNQPKSPTTIYNKNNNRDFQKHFLSCSTTCDDLLNQVEQGKLVNLNPSQNSTTNFNQTLTDPDLIVQLDDQRTNLVSLISTPLNNNLSTVTTSKIILPISTPKITSKTTKRVVTKAAIVEMPLVLSPLSKESNNKKFRNQQKNQHYRFQQHHLTTMSITAFKERNLVGANEHYRYQQNNRSYNRRRRDHHMITSSSSALSPSSPRRRRQRQRQQNKKNQLSCSSPSTTFSIATVDGGNLVANANDFCGVKEKQPQQEDIIVSPTTKFTVDVSNVHNPPKISSYGNDYDDDKHDNEIFRNIMMNTHHPSNNKSQQVITLDNNNNPTNILITTLLPPQPTVPLDPNQFLSIINTNNAEFEQSKPNPDSIFSFLVANPRYLNVSTDGLEPTQMLLPSSSASPFSSVIIMDERRRQQKWLDTTMSNMLLKTYTYLRQPKVLLNYKRAVQDSITRCLAMIMEEKFKIFLIGSSLTSLGSNRSDIDLCMVIYDRRGQVDERYQNRVYAECTLGRIRHILERCGLAFESKVIRANVPILKFYDHNHVEVNLNLNKLVTVQNTLLLMHCCSLDSRVAPFLFTVKLWAHKNGINCAYFKSLSSYALSLMSIFFLQNVCQPPILPPFDHILDLIKQSTKFYSHFHSSSKKNLSSKNQHQNSVLKQLYVTTSADYHLQERNQSHNQQNFVILPPPPPPLPPFINYQMNIPRNISRVSLLPDVHHSHDCLNHYNHNHNQAYCSGSQASSHSCSSSTSSSASSTCSSLNSSSSSLVDPTNNFGVIDPIVTMGAGNPTSNTMVPAVYNLHFSHNVPAAIAMTFAAQRSCLPSTTTTPTNENNQTKEIVGFQKSQQEESVQPNKTTTITVMTNNSSSISPLHMNYFTFYYYFCQQQLQQAHPQLIYPMMKPPLTMTTIDLREQQQKNRSFSTGSKGSERGSSDDLELGIHGATSSGDNEHQDSFRSSPTAGGIGSPNSSPSSASSSSSSSLSSTSTSDSGFYHHHHNNHSTAAFDRALFDRLSLLNLSPPLTQIGDSFNHNFLNDLCKSDFNSSNENLVAFGGSEYDYFNHPNMDSCSLNSSSTSTSSSMFKSPNKQSMGSLFARFIEYYSDPSIYDYVISVRTGSLMKRTDPVFARSSYTSMDTFICVEEPFNHTNTSHSVHNDFMFNFILKSFRWTKDLLQKMKMDRDDFI